MEPYTMPIKTAAPHFGYHPQTLYAMVASGELLFGTHYLKVGGKVLIKVRAFKEYMHEKCGVAYGGD
jgi:excisionase family DNA binding protein